MNGGCCMTNSNGQEYPGAPLHDSDCETMRGFDDAAAESDAYERDREQQRREIEQRYNVPVVFHTEYGKRSPFTDPALVTDGGWCAPSEQLYDYVLSADGVAWHGGPAVGASDPQFNTPLQLPLTGLLFHHTNDNHPTERTTTMNDDISDKYLLDSMTSDDVADAERDERQNVEKYDRRAVNASRKAGKARRYVAALAAERERRERPVEPTVGSALSAIVEFEKEFRVGGTRYRYVATGVLRNGRGRWYVTNDNIEGGRSWDQLVDYIGKSCWSTLAYVREGELTEADEAALERAASRERALRAVVPNPFV